MKKISIIVLALIMALSVCLIVACTDKTPSEEQPKTYINLRSDSEQKLDVGKSMKLMFDAYVDGKRVNDGADYKSSDDKVVKVDAFGNVTAVGGGTATVTITLKADSTVSKVVNFTVHKTVFVATPGYSRGDVDLTTADTKGWVTIKPGQQTQILASECAENWYFACTLEHTGDTGADSSGRWGVGSFLVNETSPIGEVMAWFGLQPTNHANKTYTPYVGGWRVQSSGNDPEIIIHDAIANASEAKFEIIRYGVDLYCKITIGQTVAKYVYSCPSLANKPTYPGVYSQMQEVLVSEITSTSDMDDVMAKLEAFQIAEEVVIEGMSDTLIAGDTYKLVATVLPDTTFNKGVKFALKENVTGVTVTEQGVVTIASDATGTFTVVATCESDTAVTVERTYTIKAKGTSENEVIDTTDIVGEVTLDGNSVTYVSAGKTLLPVIVGDADKYAISFKSALTSGKIGFVYATKGSCNYLTATFDGDKLTYGWLGGKETVIACNTKTANEITVIRDGDYLMFVVNGKLVNRIAIELDDASIPAIYGYNAVGTVTDITAVTTAADAEEIIARYPHTVGAYVTDNGDGSYTIANKKFTENKNDINWPPVNNYENGLKFADTLTGDFTIEFKMSDIKISNMSNGEYDGKILIYLRSESKTASLQFCVKGKSGAPVIKFCPNLNDATWTEYDMPQDINLLEGENAIKVVKTNSVVELYINDVRVFEGNGGLNNSGYWNANTPCTPGIGTFCCGVTVSDVKLTTTAE